MIVHDIISIAECTDDWTAALLLIGKSSRGSGARIRVSPVELHKKGTPPRSLGSRVRFRAIDLGPLEPKRLDW